MSPASSSLLATLFRDHHRWLLARLCRQMRCRWDAEDLTAETFSQVAASRTPLTSIDEPRAFLTTIAKRLLFTLWRRRALEQAYLETLAQLPAPLAPSPEQRALLLEALQQIDAALDGLSAPVRTAFLLAQLEGLGYAAIAERLSLSERTIKRYMVQAMACCIVHLP